MSGFYELCLEVNVYLAIVASAALAYRAVMGLADNKITYRPLFVLFVLYVLASFVGSAHAVEVGTRASWVSSMYTGLHLTLIAVCIFFPGPLRKRSPQ